MDRELVHSSDVHCVHLIWLDSSCCVPSSRWHPWFFTLYDTFVPTINTNSSIDGKSVMSIIIPFSNNLSCFIMSTWRVPSISHIFPLFVFIHLSVSPPFWPVFTCFESMKCLCRTIEYPVIPQLCQLVWTGNALVYWRMQPCLACLWLLHYSWWSWFSDWDAYFCDSGNHWAGLVWWK